MDTGATNKRYSAERITGLLREADAGLLAKEPCRKHGFSEAGYYGRKARSGGMSVFDAQRLKALEGPRTASSRSCWRTRCSKSAFLRCSRTRHLSSPAAGWRIIITSATPQRSHHALHRLAGQDERDEEPAYFGRGGRQERAPERGCRFLLPHCACGGQPDNDGQPNTHPDNGCQIKC